jgi:hypothetical protein
MASMPFFYLEVFASQKLHQALVTAASMPQDKLYILIANLRLFSSAMLSMSISNIPKIGVKGK